MGLELDRTDLEENCIQIADELVSETKPKKKPDEKPMNYYLTNDAFHEELYDFILKRKINPDYIMPNSLGRMLILLINKNMSSRQFRGYSESWKQEMKSKAYIHTCKYADRYDPARGKPFAYFTQIVRRAIISVITDEKKKLAKAPRMDDTILYATDDSIKLGSDAYYQFDVDSIDYR